MVKGSRNEKTRGHECVVSKNALGGCMKSGEKEGAKEGLSWIEGPEVIAESSSHFRALKSFRCPVILVS